MTGHSEVFHTHRVTSNLAPTISSARSWPKRAYWREPHWRTPNSHVLKILTSKLFDIKILQTLFANPAPSKAFRRWGGGGYPAFAPTFPNRQQPHPTLFHEEIHNCSIRMKAPEVLCVPKAISVKRNTLRSSLRWPALLALFATAALCASKTNYLKNYKGTPYQDSRYQGGAQKIPGRVECSYYDRGGEGVAYHDADAKNNGSGGLNPADGTYLNQFRMDEGVDISYTKFHDQIDDSPYDLVKPPEKPALCRMDRARRMVQHHSAGCPRWRLQSRSSVHLKSRWNHFNGCERKGRDWAAGNRFHLQCLRSNRLAAMAPLEYPARHREGSTAGRKKRSHRPHSHRREHESRLFRLQGLSIAI
jgi:hypothetical protein